MLDAFVAENREEIARRCGAKVELRSIAGSAPAELEQGVSQFLDQLVDALRDHDSLGPEIGPSAARHGRDRQLQGLTVSQVVHDYGDVCQSITDLAMELKVPISVADFRTLNRCLDDAIASAVTEFGRGNEAVLAADSIRDVEHLGFLAHEVRNLVGTASIAFEVLKTGTVGIGGSTGSVLQRSLSSLRDLIGRSVDEVRLRHAPRTRTQFALDEFIAELAPAATMEAGVRGLSFRVEGGDPDARVDADRPVLAAVVTNLLQNAFKFTRPGSSVTLRGSTTDARVLIAVEDQCSGLPEGKIDDLFRPFEQRSVDRTGLGLGLAMCRWGAGVNGGHISARNLDHQGCVFTVDLPRS
jgi:signal transduction histidine kinase